MLILSPGLRRSLISTCAPALWLLHMKGLSRPALKSAEGIRDAWSTATHPAWSRPHLLTAADLPQE